MGWGCSASRWGEQWVAGRRLRDNCVACEQGVLQGGRKQRAEVCRSLSITVGGVAAAQARNSAAGTGVSMRRGLQAEKGELEMPGKCAALLIGGDGRAGNTDRVSGAACELLPATRCSARLLHPVRVGAGMRPMPAGGGLSR
jgi:hypothetical protein